MTTVALPRPCSRWLGVAFVAWLALSAPTYAQVEASEDVSAFRSGVMAYRQGDYARALPFLRQAQSADAGSVNIRYYLAIVLDKLDRGAEALAHYDYVTRYGNEDRVVAYARQRAQALGISQRQTPGAGEPVLAAQQAVMTSSRQSVLVPLQPHQNALMVEARLNDLVSANFIVDTGATYTSISQQLADALGDSVKPLGTVRITTANGRIEARKVLIERISVNGVEAHNVEATVIDVRPGSSFSGLLGLSFIRQFRLTIDPQEGLLVFQPH
ncbi:MAG: TIGR02281 family clan AA aspartic protease [Vampirovibrionales bacterium]|nr:TIGR02281 family clan AA aspartic protease [Vampirovibrionales bacterium]